MLSAVAFAVVLAAADPRSIGIPVQLPTSPLQLDQVSSPWVIAMDYAAGRAGEVTYQDCVAIRNRSTSTVTHVQVVFSAVDVHGTPKRPNLPLDLRATVKADQPWPGGGSCRPGGYGNGDGGLWLVAWVNEVDFADGTSWHAPPERDLFSHITYAVREHSAQH